MKGLGKRLVLGTRFRGEGLGLGFKVRLGLKASI